MAQTEDIDSSSSSDYEDRIDLADDPQWKDIEPDEEKISVLSFFDEARFPDVQSMLQYCKKEYNFDLVKIVKSFDLEFLETVKLVNYTRKEAKKGARGLIIPSRSVFEDDQYLLPILEDDAVLFNLDEVIQSPETATEEAAHDGLQDQALEGDIALKRVAELEGELQRLHQEFKCYRKVVDETLESRWTNEQPNVEISKYDVRKVESADERSKSESGYFTSYSYNGQVLRYADWRRADLTTEIHEIMLKDTIRTDAYRDFIYDNKDLFRDKIVLDVGCGTGILSLFCAKAGAARVIAVDNSDIIDKARENVFVNGFGNKIDCIRGKIEEVSLPVPHVDVIVSEWMGYCLLYEAMLDSVLWARDHYLKTDGLMVPSNITLFLAPLADPDYITDHIAFWRSVYGFKMDSMLAHIYDEVLIRDVDPNNLPGAATPFFRLDLHSITADQLDFTDMPFHTKLEENIDSLDGFVIWFDAFFLTSKEASGSLPSDSQAAEWAKDRGVAFTTGPLGPSTHWQQGVLLIDHGKPGFQPLEKGQTIDGTVGYKKRSDDQRALNIDVKWRVEEGKNSGKQTWSMR